MNFYQLYAWLEEGSGRNQLLSSHSFHRSTVELLYLLERRAMTLLYRYVMFLMCPLLSWNPNVIHAAQGVREKWAAVPFSTTWWSQWTGGALWTYRLLAIKTVKRLSVEKVPAVWVGYIHLSRTHVGECKKKQRNENKKMSLGKIRWSWQCWNRQEGIN